MDTITIEIDKETAKLLQDMISSKLADYSRRFEMKHDKEFDFEDAPDWFHGLVNVDMEIDFAMQEKDVA